MLWGWNKGVGGKFLKNCMNAFLTLQSMHKEATNETKTKLLTKDQSNPLGSSVSQVLEDYPWGYHSL